MKPAVFSDPDVHETRFTGSYLKLFPSAGTFPVVALMTGNAISRITHDLAICNEVMASGNSSSNFTTDMFAMEATTTAEGGVADPCGYSLCVQQQISIAVTLSLLVGILMVSGCG